jgi:hypothetical protein
MSGNLPTKIGDKSAAYKNFWRAQRPKVIYNMFTQGKTVAEICEATSLNPEQFCKIIVHPMFLRKLESHLRGILFAHQAAQIIGLEEITNKLWDRVRNNIDSISVEVCLKELVRLLPLQKEQAKLDLNIPKDSSVQVNIGNFSPTQKMEEAMKKFKDTMGYEGLEEDEDAKYIDGNVSETINPIQDESKDTRLDPGSGS